MVKNCRELPAHYRMVGSIQLKENKKLFILINVFSILISVALFFVGTAIVPLKVFFYVDREHYWLRYGVMLVGAIAYIVLHEAVHGIFMRLWGCGIKPTFGFGGVYAWAGSRAYFNRRCYLIIGLAPVVIWGVVLLIVGFLVPHAWFWVIYFIQIVNVSGAAGDFYVTARLMKAPDTLLVQDDGVSMRLYLPENEEI